MVIMIYLRDGRVNETLCLCDDDFISWALDLRQPKEDHEDEAEADTKHLQHWPIIDHYLQQSEGVIKEN